MDVIEEKDWDRGLPPNVLPLVAKTGGVNATKVMREISKSWQESFEPSVTCITIPNSADFPYTLLFEAAFSLRFPALTKLDLARGPPPPLPQPQGQRPLKHLGNFPKLKTLILGSVGMLFQKDFTTDVCDEWLMDLQGLHLTPPPGPDRLHPSDTQRDGGSARHAPHQPQPARLQEAH